MVYLTSLGKLTLARSLAKVELDVLFSSVHCFSLMDCMQVETGSNVNVDINGYLMEQGLSLSRMNKDGNCFFNSVATALLSNTTYCLEGDHALLQQSACSTRYSVCGTYAWKWICKPSFGVKSTQVWKVQWNMKEKSFNSRWMVFTTVMLVTLCLKHFRPY